MDTKLTLKLNKKIIEKAKKYASRQNLSLSRLIESYLQSLTSDLDADKSQAISPFVKSLATGVKIPVDINHKEDYSDHLIKKYK